MSVKKKDRHVAKAEALGKSRKLFEQIMILTRPRQYDAEGKSKVRPGLLGEGQPLLAFGQDLIKNGKTIHALCYEGYGIKLHDAPSHKQRNELHRKAIAHCKSILRQVDLCIHLYARDSKKKRSALQYLAKLAYDLMQSLYDRINRDKIIYEKYYQEKDEVPSS